MHGQRRSAPVLMSASATASGAAEHGACRCSDASTVWRRFALGLGMRLVAKSDQSTGNSTYASYVLRFVCAWSLARRHSRPSSPWLNVVFRAHACASFEREH